jgi:hypothetical protein
MQYFWGHLNLQLFMDRIVPTWPDVTDVLFTGESAGGFGAAANYDYLASGWPDLDAVLIDDSAPIFRDQFLDPCLQQAFRDTWGLDAALPQDCEDCFNADGGGLSNYFNYIAEKYPNANFGLISSERDQVISTFFSFGLNDCNAGFPNPFGYADTFEMGLYDLRDNVLGNNPRFATYYIAGSSHTWTSGGAFQDDNGTGTVLADWYADVIAGTFNDVVPN